MGADNTHDPITDKLIYDKTTSDLRLGVCEMQGWRRTMEDSSIALVNFDKNTSLFGIMDGHGGPIISKFVAYNLKNVLTNIKAYKEKKYEQALIESFMKLDEYLRNTQVNDFLYKNRFGQLNDEKELDTTKTNTNNSITKNSNGVLKYKDKILYLEPKTQNCLVNEEEGNKEQYAIQVAKEMGTTANVLLLTNSTMYIANVGDSLSVMYKNGKAIKLNQEHKTTLRSEYERIEKSGGHIINNRIEGKLNLTRAIGDLTFKNNSNLKAYEQSVTAYPEITKIQSIEGIEFIIMGCDGLWDCVQPQELCENISKQLKDNPYCPLSTIIANVFDRIISPSNNSPIGTDNMSCMIIQFLKHK